MGVDKSGVGKALTPVRMTIDGGRLRFFAKAIGETNPIYTDVEAARQAGHPDLPVPPSFLFGIEMETPEPFGWFRDFGVELRHVLHGEESFTYHSVAHAGDTLVAAPRIADIYDRKGSALSFIVKETEITREDGSPVADLRNIIVVRNMSDSETDQ
ncbi:MaoC family dehydratase N-terminal domain-containing protein [Micromonospora sp. NPDC050495]|uniref:MaoC family dehydratase N-terminal domain-containing protein n=1 Tax=Micromonospora sp. NPDC050495 TaxID=3154936 RepID=UPI0033FBE1C8